MTRTMTCRDGVRLLVDYTEGLLAPARRRAVEHHVAGCRRCRRFVRSYGETPRIIGRATATRMPDRLGGRLRRMIGGLSAAGPDRSRS